MNKKNIALFILMASIILFGSPISVWSKPSAESHKQVNHGESIHHSKGESTDYQHSEYIQIHHADRVPNFARNHTVISRKSGKWSDPDSWSTGKIPDKNDRVFIDAKHRLVYDLNVDTPIDAIGVSGQLSFATSKSTQMSVTHFLVYPSGKLIIGTEEEPVSKSVTATITINDRPINTEDPNRAHYDPAQYGNGLLVWGELVIFGADKGVPISRLVSGANAGDERLRLDVPGSWAVGDDLLIPSSQYPDAISEPGKSKLSDNSERQFDQENAAYKAADQLELVNVKQVSKNTISLNKPLKFSHLGISISNDSVKRNGFLPHVANISRNVTIGSANPNGVRGHTVAFHNSKVNIQNARFHNLGRTTVEVIDNTAFNEDGQAIYIGQNQVARYPVHMHHQNDPSVVDGNSPTFIVKRNVIAGAKRWSMSVHGSHYGLIEENIAYDVNGAGFVTEDGSETGNRFVRNFVAAVHGSGLEIDARERGQGVGHEGSGFWLGSDNNELVGNVVAGARASGYALFRTENSVSIPAFPKIITGNSFSAPRVFRFLDNEAYSISGHGVRLWSTKECDLCRSKTSLLQETRIWNSANGVMFDYHSDYYVFDGLNIVGSNRTGSVGVLANHAKIAEVKRANIANMSVGVEGGGLRNKSFKISDSQVRASTGIKVMTPTSWGRAQNFTVDNVKFHDLGDGQKNTHIEFGAQDYGKRKVKLSIKRPVYVYNYQQNQGANYQIFKFQQAPDTPFPQSADATVGCPENGLTNAECFARHRVSYGGELATCATVKDRIAGFACPIKISE